ncbi:MAG: hypothetical protein ACP5Q4_09220, partial [Candidatus Caldatribacteriaceae bacterium]
MFYLSDEDLFFTNQPNLNRLIVEMEENLSEKELHEEEKNAVKACISGMSRLKVFPYPPLQGTYPI